MKIIFGTAAEEDVSKIPLTNNTVSRRIQEISHNTEINVNNKSRDIVFALWLDENTDEWEMLINKFCWFPCFEKFLNQLTQSNRNCLNKVIIAHFNALKTIVTKYFPSVSI